MFFHAPIRHHRVQRTALDDEPAHVLHVPQGCDSQTMGPVQVVLCVAAVVLALVALAIGAMAIYGIVSLAKFFAGS